jgi:hypothetical protein
LADSFPKGQIIPIGLNVSGQDRAQESSNACMAALAASCATFTKAAPQITGIVLAAVVIFEVRGTSTNAAGVVCDR